MLRLVGSLTDLAVVSMVDASDVYASWEGFDAVVARLRGVTTVVGIINLAAAEFAYGYWSVSQRDANAFTEPLDRASAVYLSVGTFTTVDVGALAPLSSAARVVAAGQMGFGVAAFVVGLASVVGASSRSRSN